MRIEVLVSHIYEQHHFDRLVAEFPALSFTKLPSGEPWPEVVSRATALLFAGLRKPELSNLLRAAPRLEWIHTGSAGFDWVMVPEVEERGIVVTRSMDVMSIPIAEFVLGAMLRNAKNFPALEAAQARREWKPPFHQELRGKEVLVVGAGSIGTRVARLCAAFGMRVVGISRSGQANDAFTAIGTPDVLDVLLPAADYVVLTAPGTPETEGMFDARRLGLMKEGSYLINVARGSLVVEADLLAALASGRLAGACLDAFTVEPLPPDSPLWGADNLFISPHASYRTPEIRARVFDEFSRNLRALLEGRPLAGRMRNKELGY
ncbi:MAG: D-2-hydroxyacid dehydrogenase [Trueperaceae bacterium]|nr:D-2-hydroxyacid dehydrogenase [Trueperaceae bacterium]MCW5819657.1 D-2-hydroxyacid dehydrogenase [Trueperaceae bacterium]